MDAEEPGQPGVETISMWICFSLLGVTCTPEGNDGLDHHLCGEVTDAELHPAN